MSVVVFSFLVLLLVALGSEIVVAGNVGVVFGKVDSVGAVASVVVAVESWVVVGFGVEPIIGDVLVAGSATFVAVGDDVEVVVVVVSAVESSVAVGCIVV